MSETTPATNRETNIAAALNRCLKFERVGTVGKDDIFSLLNISSNNYYKVIVKDTNSLIAIFEIFKKSIYSVDLSNPNSSDENPYTISANIIVDTLYLKGFVGDISCYIDFYDDFEINFKVITDNTIILEDSTKFSSDSTTYTKAFRSLETLTANNLVINKLNLVADEDATTPVTDQETPTNSDPTLNMGESTTTNNYAANIKFKNWILSQDNAGNISLELVKEQEE